MNEWTESEIDDILADSFPASDPPSWTLGIATTAESSEPDIPVAPPVIVERS